MFLQLHEKEEEKTVRQLLTEQEQEMTSPQSGSGDSCVYITVCELCVCVFQVCVRGEYWSYVWDVSVVYELCVRGVEYLV